MNIFVTGIGTDVGKTLASAFLVELLQADYWKPIQSGVPDSETILPLIHSSRKILPSIYTFKTPASPHHAAATENCEIKLSKLVLPQNNNHIVIEGAGGLMVPISPKILQPDLILQWKTPVVLVIKHYLGSINHSLLTIFVLKRLKIQIKAIIFNDHPDDASTQAILKFSGIQVPVYYLPHLNILSYEKIYSLIKLNEAQEFLKLLI